MHKPHGSIYERNRRSGPRERYLDLHFTIERIGTAPDDELSAWFQEVLAGKTLFVTGYSAQDLDIFPALRSVQGMERVYWNFFQRSDWEERDDDPPPKKALLKWLDGAYLLFGPVAEHLPTVLEKVGMEPSVLGGADKNKPHGCSPGAIMDNKPGLLLGGALVLHSVNRPGQEEAVRTILKRLRKWTNMHHTDDRYPDDVQRRFRIMANQLDADLLQEASSPKAYRAYRKTVRLLDAYVGDEIAAEVTPRQTRCKMLWSAMRRTPGIEGVLFRPAWSFFRLWLMGRGWETRDAGTRRLAQHFVGGVFFRLALYVDVILDLPSTARLFYAIAHGHYSRATRRLGPWRARDTFHYSRADESWLLSRRRTGQREGLLVFPGGLEKRLAHYEYVQGVLEGDVGLAQVLLFRALAARLTPPRDADSRAGIRDLLRKASTVYATRNYRAGIERAQVYRWILEPGVRMAGSLTRAIGRVATLRAIQRDPEGEADRLLRELSPV